MVRFVKRIPFIFWRKFRTWLPAPLARAISNLAIEIVHAFNHLVGVRRIKGLMKSGNSLFQLELAGGSRELGKFVNVGWGTQYPIDLRRKMPFRDATFDRIYSSHVLEHLSPRELEFLLMECNRILKPGGIFEAALPNTIDSIIRYAEYSKGIIPNYELSTDSSQYSCATDKLVHSVFCDYQHLNIFAQDNATLYLQKSGFCDVRLREFDASVDLEVRKGDSFYVLARKNP